MGGKRQVRGVGISLTELSEESVFGKNARAEIARWFPHSAWVTKIPTLVHQRELPNAERRRILLALAGGTGLVLPQLGCGAVGLIFEALQVASQIYKVAQKSGGDAIFTNATQSREKSQLLTSLNLGNPDSYEAQDAEEFLVDVPAQQMDWLYAFDGLVSEATGEHFMSGTAAGTTLLTDIFSYVV